MKKRTVIILFLCLIVLVKFVSTSHEIGDTSYSIDKQYGPLDYIRGWINISLESEPANSVFNDSRGNLITLINLLKQNEGFNYSCSTQNCISDYSATNSEETKTFNLDSKESKIMGFKFTNYLNSIDSINFTIESNVPSACYNQLKIDILNDGTIDMGNNKSVELSTACSFSKNSGCFDDSITTSGYEIGAVPNKHCQRVRLYEFPGFRLGAWVKKYDDPRTLIMELYDLNLGIIEGANCELPEAPVNGGEIYCDIDYLVTKSNDYYVCIYSNLTGASKIKGYYDPEGGCGFYGAYVKPEDAAFKIFAEGKKFKAVGTLEISNSLPEGPFGGTAQNYIFEKYGTLDCSTNNCIIPIKFISGENQEITINNLLIEYTTILGATQDTYFYDLEETPSKISADFQKLYLDKGNFSVSNEYGNFTFELSLNDAEILSEKVIVERVPIIKRLTPTTTASVFPTDFTVAVDSFSNITIYEWDFGDGMSEITSTNKITHTYSAAGEYDMKIKITDTNQLSSYRTFGITVGLPKNIINDMLVKMQKDLTNVNTQIKEFPAFYKKSLNSILNISSFNDKLKNLQEANKTAVSEEDYNNIMTDLLYLKIPESVAITKSTDLISFYPDRDNIDLDILQLIGEGVYDASDEEKYINSVLAWNQQNMETKVTLDELSAIYKDFGEPILKVFELKISKKNILDYDIYLIIPELDDLKFKADYAENNESGYVYIDLTESEETIIFSTTEDINFADLPVFISPSIDKLAVVSFEEIEKETKWLLFILIISLLILVGFISYVVLQIWYQKKYENYLFKNKNNLYNLITYIENARRKGLKNDEIIVKLGKAGWSSERIRYVMRKYSGKRTGMFKILPIGKILSKIKKGKESPQKEVGKSYGGRVPILRKPQTLRQRKIPRKRFFRR